MELSLVTGLVTNTPTGSSGGSSNAQGGSFKSFNCLLRLREMAVLVDCCLAGHLCKSAGGAVQSHSLNPGVLDNRHVTPLVFSKQ